MSDSLHEGGIRGRATSAERGPAKSMVACGRFGLQSFDDRLNRISGQRRVGDGMFFDNCLSRQIPWSTLAG